MKRLFSLILAAVVSVATPQALIVTASVAGTASLTACAADATARWAQARVSLTSAQDTLKAAYEVGLIDDDVILEADPLIQSARAGLEVAETQLPDGGDTFNERMAIIDGIIDELLAMAARGEL